MSLYRTGTQRGRMKKGERGSTEKFRNERRSEVERGKIGEKGALGERGQRSI